MPGGSLSDEEFDAVIKEAIASLPPALQAATEEIMITVADRPDPELGVSRSLLGLFTGVPRGQHSVFDTVRVPDQVYLFQRNIERAGRTRREIVAEIRTTLFHELGHYLGFGERELRELGLE